MKLSYFKLNLSAYLLLVIFICLSKIKLKRTLQLAWKVQRVRKR